MMEVSKSAHFFLQCWEVSLGLWHVTRQVLYHQTTPQLSLSYLISPPILCFFSQAADFRQFWGSRSELRRFQDGAIREAVVWEAASMSEKRLIPHQVVTHLLAL